MSAIDRALSAQERLWFISALSISILEHPLKGGAQIWGRGLKVKDVRLRYILCGVGVSTIVLGWTPRQAPVNWGFLSPVESPYVSTNAKLAW